MDEQLQPPAFDRDIALSGILGSYASLDLLSAVKRCAKGALNKPVFVVGSPRSGTSVIGRCLASHPMLAGGEESLFLMHFWRIFDDLYLGNNIKKVAPLNRYLSANDLLTALQSVAAGILERPLKAKQAARYVDHTPWYAVIAPFVDILFPDAIYIHTIRDGRAVVTSLEQSRRLGFEWAGCSTADRVRLWRHLVWCGRQIREFAGERYIEVQYEHFLGSPMTVMRMLLQKLDLNFTTSVLHPLLELHAGPAASPGIPITADDPRMIGAQITLPRSWPPHWDSSARNEFMSIAEDLMIDLYGGDWEDVAAG